MFKKIKQMFCKHSYKLISPEITEGYKTFRVCQCTKCGKTKEI